MATETIGSRLKQVILDRKIAYKVVSDKSGIKPPTLHKLLNQEDPDKERFRVKDIKSICAAIDCDPVWAVFG